MSSEPQNDLERSLTQAAKEPAHQPPEKMPQVLDGQEQYLVSEDRPASIMPPPSEPTELVVALRAFFKKNHRVKRAWVVYVFNPKTQEKPNTLIGVDTDGDWDRIVIDAAVVATSVSIPDPPVAFVQVNTPELEKCFCTEARPFYKKKLFGLF